MKIGQRITVGLDNIDNTDDLIFSIGVSVIARYLYGSKKILFFDDCELTIEQINSIISVINEYTKAKKEIVYNNNRIETLLEKTY